MITRWIEMICDGCFVGTGDVVPSGDSKSMRREWLRQGWTRAEGKDFCGECSAKTREEPTR